LLFLLKRCLVIAGVRAGSQARDDLTWVTMDAQALEMCSQCLLLLEECSELSAVQEMNQSIEVQFTSCEPFYSSLAFCVLLCQV
jgi:hypothetical protein